MFADELHRAVATATGPQLDQLAREIWRAHASGVLNDDQAQAAAEAVNARHIATRPPGRFKPASIAFRPPRQRQRSPDRQASLERRRRLAASGPLPPGLAAHFTTGELAVLRIVGDEVRVHGVCALHIDAIAARAGVCRTSVQNALREARRLGLVTVQERRRRGQRSLTNLVRIVSREWLTWLRLAAGIGFKKKNTTAKTRESKLSLTDASQCCTQHPTQRDAPPCPTALQRPQRPPP